MHFPLKSSLQFVSLNQKNQILSRHGSDLQSLTKTYLLNPLLEFELGKKTQIEAGNAHLAQAEELLLSALRLDKKIRQLNKNDLLGFYDRLGPDRPTAYRQNQVRPLTPAHVPSDPSLILRAVDRFFEWVGSPSFDQMHAVEQMTVSLMRLYEIYPFAEKCEVTISVFSYFFLVADGFLPPLYEVRELPSFYEALNDAFSFSTEALVRLNTRACERAYDLVLGTLGEQS